MKLKTKPFYSRAALAAAAASIAVAAVLLPGLPRAGDGANGEPRAAAAEPEGAAPTPAEEFALGLQARRAFLAQNAVLPDDDERVRAVRAIGGRLAAVSERPDLPWVFHVLDGSWRGDARQAVSLPGGTVALTHGLLDALGHDPDRIAFALAHEIAHVALRHHLCVEGAIRADARDVSLRHELEADRYGALYAVRAGFAWSAARDALHALDVGTARMESGHPTYDRRRQALDDLQPVLRRSVAAFRAGVDALDAGDALRAVDAFEIFVRQFPQAVEGRVDLGLALLVAARADRGGPGGLEEPLPLVRSTGIALRGPGSAEALPRAEAQFRRALALAPTDARARIGLALVAFRTGRVAAGEAWLDRAAVTAERAPDLLLARGIGRYLADDAAAAAELFHRAREARPGWPAAAKNLALAYEALGEERSAAEIWRELTADPRLAEEARWQVAVLDAGG